MIRRLLAAAALLGAALLAMPAAAADPPLTSLPFTAGGQTYNEATYSDGTRFFVDHMVGGWTGAAWKPWTLDANGYGGVNVFSSALPAGAATAAKQDSLLTALGSPLQAGGSVAISNSPTVNIGSIGGGATASAQGTAQTSLTALVAAQGAPTDAKSIATDATAASETALLKGQIDRLQALINAVGSPAQVGGKVDTVIVGTAADRGALVGTTSVTLMAANTARRGFSLQVQSSSASCYLSGLATATADYHSLLIGGSQPTYYETKDSHVGQGAINLICTAANTPVYAREW